MTEVHMTHSMRSWQYDAEDDDKLDTKAAPSDTWHLSSVVLAVTDPS